MLTEIVNALRDFNEKGIAVIPNSEEYEAKTVAGYVVQTLIGLKCQFQVIDGTNELISAVVIEDRMMEP